MNVKGFAGIFLETVESVYVDFLSCIGKTLYKYCVICFNRKMLDGKIDTPWRDFFKLDADRKPQWRALYKPPLIKEEVTCSGGSFMGLLQSTLSFQL